MGENERRKRVAQGLAESGQRRRGVKWKIIGRLLLYGGTVEAPRASAALELPDVPARSRRAKQK